MFLENDYARPLFDFVKGGPPKAFQCLVLISIPELFGQHPCGRVTRTERGMRMHLKAVHHWEEQPCLYSTEHPSAQSSGRKLRAGAPLLKSSNENQNMETTNLSKQKQAEMNEGGLLKLMREEK